MANRFYNCILLSGGGTGALDAIVGNDLVESDGAIVQTNGNVYFYYLDATSGASESEPSIIAPDVNPGTKRWILQTTTAVAKPYILVSDAKASGTQGGTHTQDAWQKRDCAEDTDTHDLCSVASSVITLQAGTYDAFIIVTFFDTLRSVIRLYNTSDSTVAARGEQGYGFNTYNGCGHLVIHGRFTIASAKNFEIQHYCTATKATNGLGVACTNGEDEIYLLAEFRKVN